MMSSPNSPDLNPLDYHVRGQCWSLITSCNRSKKTVPGFKDALQLIWFALPEKAIDNSVKDHRKRPQASIAVDIFHM